MRVTREVRGERGVSEGRGDPAGQQRQHEGRATGDREVDGEKDPQHADGRRLLQRHRGAWPLILTNLRAAETGEV